MGPAEKPAFCFVLFKRLRDPFITTRLAFNRLSDLTITRPLFRITGSDLKITASELKISVSDPKITRRDPRITQSDPKITRSDPQNELRHAK